MSSEWPIVKLGRLADFQEGYVNPSQRDTSYFDGPIKWLRATDLNDSLVTNTSRTLSNKGFKSAGKSALLFEPGTLAISKSGTIGRLGLLGDYMCGNRAVINIKPKPNAVPRYLFFVLRHLRPTIETLAEGSVQKNLYVSTLSNLDVPAPPRDVQQVFAETLGVLDDRITLLRETNATLEAIAQALFKSWFVDFDPVRAKMEGRAPEGMDEATAALFPDSFDETDLGVVPRGWRVGTLADLMRLHKGSVNPGAHPDTEFQHFSLPAFDAGQLPIVEHGSTIKSNKTSVPTDAVLLSKLNPHIPRIWLPSEVGKHAVCSTEFLPYLPSRGYTTAFVYCLLSAPDFSHQLCQLVTGTSNSHQRIKPESVLTVASRMIVLTRGGILY